MEDTKKYVVTEDYTGEDGHPVTVGTELDLTEEQAEKLKDLVEPKDVASPDAEPEAAPEAGPDAPVEPPVGEGEQGVDPTPEVPAEPEAEAEKKSQ